MDTAAPSTPLLASAVADSLRRHGVRRMFGIPGGGSSLELIEAAGGAGIDFVLARTETAAAIMAAVTGELTGAPGVVLTGVGPGAASAVNGIAYAHLEKAPVLLFTDGPASSLHQAFDQNALFAPITRRQGRLRPDGGGAEIETAIAAALTPPWGPVHLDLTADDARTPVSGEDGAPPRPPEAKPDPAALDHARALLAESRRPVIVAGLEARYGAHPQALRALSDALACPVMPTYKAKGALADDHPGVTGVFTGAVADGDVLDEADLIVLFGFDPIEKIPGAWEYAAPVLDLTAFERAAPPIEPACRVVGPLPETIDSLLQEKPATNWKKDEIAELRERLRKRIALRGSGHTADTAIAALAGAAPEGCRLSVDAGAHMFSVFAGWQAREPFGMLKSNGLSSMGFALPAAIASALQEPERPAAAITGDGGMLMSLSELTTAVEHGCNIVTVVINDAALSLIDIKQQRQQYRSSGVRYPSVDFAASARGLGCRAWRVEPGEPLAPVLEQAFAGPGPALVDVICDPDGYGDQLEALRG